MIVYIEWNETSFQNGVGSVRIHAGQEAMMKDLVHYSIIFLTFAIKIPVRIAPTDPERQPDRKCCKLMEPSSPIDIGKTDDNDNYSATEGLWMPDQQNRFFLGVSLEYSNLLKDFLNKTQDNDKRAKS